MVNILDSNSESLNDSGKRMYERWESLQSDITLEFKKALKRAVDENRWGVVQSILDELEDLHSRIVNGYGTIPDRHRVIELYERHRADKVDLLILDLEGCVEGDTSIPSYLGRAALEELKEIASADDHIFERKSIKRLVAICFKVLTDTKTLQ